MANSQGNNSIEIRMLASGSGGNSILVSSKNANLLIDAGLSCKELLRRVALAGLAPSDLSAVIVTHEHQDHIRGVGVLSRRHHIPIYISSPTLDASRAQIGEAPSTRTFAAGDTLTIEDLTVQTYPVLHDAADPVGLCVRNSSKRLGVALDMGRPTTLVKERLRGTDALIMEFNHDPHMLKQCTRPWEVKQRIMSKNGHMSNGAALDFMCELMHDRLQTVVAAHISQEANSADLVYETVSKRLKKIGRPDVRIVLASQDEVGDAIRI